MVLVGRLVLRALVETGRNDLQIVAINSPGADDVMAHLLAYDTSHGKFDGTITQEGDMMDFGHGQIPLFHERDPGKRHGARWVLILCWNVPAVLMTAIRRLPICRLVQNVCLFLPRPITLI